MALSENVAVGLGMDAHQFRPGGPLVLGGVEIDYDMGLEGHSDGDCLMHAVLDAVLSAADLPDLGELFPETDENKGRSSTEMAKEVARRMSIAGARILSLDAIVLTQKPRISPLRLQLRESIAACFDIPVSKVNVKGKTFDHMGPIGNLEGIESRAVALVERAAV